MNPIPVTVVARLKAQPGKEDEMGALLSGLVAPTRQEEGCLNYDLHRSAGDPALFLFHENWRSRPDLDRHLASAHLRAALARVEPILAEPPQIEIWSRIA